MAGGWTGRRATDRLATHGSRSKPASGPVRSRCVVARHPRDVVSLVLGLLLLLAGGLFLLDDLGGGSVDLHWVGPVALGAVGALGLAASVRHR